MGYGSQGTKKDRSDGKKATGKKERFNDSVFIQYELDETAQAACKAQPNDAGRLLDACHMLVDGGYAITLKFDKYSDAYAAWIRQTEPYGANAGFILSGRGSSPAKALKQALFKHFEVMSESWEQFSAQPISKPLDD